MGAGVVVGANVDGASVVLFAASATHRRRRRCRGGAMLASQCWGCHAVNQGLLSPAGLATRRRRCCHRSTRSISGLGQRIRSNEPGQRPVLSAACGVEPSFGELCWSYLSLVVIVCDVTRAQSAACVSISEARGGEEIAQGNKMAAAGPICGT